MMPRNRRNRVIFPACGYAHYRNTNLMASLAAFGSLVPFALPLGPVRLDYLRFHPNGFL